MGTMGYTTYHSYLWRLNMIDGYDYGITSITWDISIAPTTMVKYSQFTSGTAPPSSDFPPPNFEHHMPKFTWRILATCHQKNEGKEAIDMSLTCGAG